MKKSGYRIVGTLPDGKHAVAETRRISEAICTECLDCGADFDNNVTFMALSQKIYFHNKGTGHTRFAYYTIIEVEA